MLTLGTVVITVEDLPRARAFWKAALGYLERTPTSDDDDWVILDPRPGTTGGSVALSVTGYPQHHPPRLHLDLYADDQAAEIARLLSLGAHEVDWHGYPDGADWVVLEDTEGNRFCVIDKAPSGR